MSKEPLLLPSAKSGVLARERPHISPLWRWGAIFIGLLVVFVGGADMVNRLEAKVGGLGDIGFLAFAPVALIEDPSLIETIQGESVATNPIIPLHVRVPGIDVDALVEAVGKKPDGAMATPTRFSDVAWYSLGSKPGGSGSAVFAGHVNNALGMDGVFADLADVAIGDTIEIEGTRGEVLTYEVAEITIYPADEAPTQELFRTTGRSQIVLITCDGEWDSLARSYDKRLVVVAHLASL